MTSQSIHDALCSKWSRLGAVPNGWSCDDAVAFLLLAAFEDSDHVDELIGVLRDARQQIDDAVAAVEEVGL